MMNRIGPRTEPCGTPKETEEAGDSSSRMATENVRDERYDEIQLSAVSPRPNQDDRRVRRIVWSMVSNAAERSRRQRPVTFWCAIDCTR